MFTLLSSVLDYDLLGIFYNESDKKDKIIYFAQNEYDIETSVLKVAKDKILANIISSNITAHSSMKLDYKIFNNHIGQHNLSESISTIDEFKSNYIVPLEVEGKLIGTVALFSKNANAYINKDILNIIITELKMVLKIKWLYSETKLLSIIDPLTELYNRRYFQQVLEKEFSRSNRYSSPLSMAMIDIDNFKNLNDTYGHQFGDEVLQVISNLFKESLRKTDYIARYGGEELIAILPETTIAQAIIPLERLRCKIADYIFMQDFKRINVTISIGIAQNDFNYISTDEFLKEIEKAIYEAKQKGKNRIELIMKRNK